MDTSSKLSRREWRWQICAPERYFAGTAEFGHVLGDEDKCIDDNNQAYTVMVEKMTSSFSRMIRE
jgi:hypothetical protein